MNRGSCSEVLSCSSVRKILQILQCKQILNFYSNFMEKFKPNINLLNQMAGRSPTGTYEESILSFIEHQQYSYRQQINRLDDITRKYMRVGNKQI